MERSAAVAAAPFAGPSATDSVVIPVRARSWLNRNIRSFQVGFDRKSKPDRAPRPVDFETGSPNMPKIRKWPAVFGVGLLTIAALSLLGPARAADVEGTVKSVDPEGKSFVVVRDDNGDEIDVSVGEETTIEAGEDKKVALDSLTPGAHVVVHQDMLAARVSLEGEVLGSIQAISLPSQTVTVKEDYSGHVHKIPVGPATKIESKEGNELKLSDLSEGSHLIVFREGGTATRILRDTSSRSVLAEFWHNFRHNLFKPLLLFFYMGFLIPILRVKFEFPYVIYQGLTIYLLIAIGWHGGEELAELDAETLGRAVGFMVVGFVTNIDHRHPRLPGPDRS